MHYFNGDKNRAGYETRIIFDKLDFNNNGTIDYSEFLIANLDPIKIVNEARLREVFDIFDYDRSGAITVDEIKKILGGGGGPKGEKKRDSVAVASSVGAQPTENAGVDDAEWDLILGEVDVNGDGEISFEEFLEMIFKIFGMEDRLKHKTLEDVSAAMGKEPGLLSPHNPGEQPKIVQSAT